MIKITILLIVCLATTQAGLFTKFYPLAEELVSHMTLDQKLGQTIQADFQQFNLQGSERTLFEQIEQFQMGSVLIGGNGCPDGQGNVRIQDDYTHATLEGWRKIAEKSQSYSPKIQTPLGEVEVKLLIGTDAVHGNQHAVGEILFPHNIGLASSHNPQHFANAAKWNKKSIQQTGFNFAFAPTVAVSHNPQWGRFYETIGTDTELIKQYAKSYVQNIQDIQGDYIKGVLASTKHFLGDGATYRGHDEGNAKVYDMITFLETNLAGYRGALEADTGNIMVSYSAINDIAMTISNTLLQGELKDRMGFDGFLISDYDAIGKVSYQGYPTTGVKMSLKQSYLMSLSAGIDMVMLAPNKPNAIDEYLSIAKELLTEGSLMESRINDAVKRILAVKLSMNLVKVPKQLAEQFNYENSDILAAPAPSLEEKQQEYQEVLQAAQESLVLLQNEGNALPLNKTNLKYVVLLGERLVNSGGVDTLFQDFNNIGVQNGGWSVRWQGYNGNEYWSGALKDSSRASSLLDGIEAELQGQETRILKHEYESFTDLDLIGQGREKFLNEVQGLKGDMNSENTVVIQVMAENPYSEFMGDINNEFCAGTGEWVEGCIYNSHANEYLPYIQKTDLKIDIDDQSKIVLGAVKDIDADIPVVTVLFSGRPQIINDLLPRTDAFVAAWWPGTAGGEAVTNALFGNYLFRGGNNSSANTLPFPWPRDMESLKNYPVYEKGFPRLANPLFAEGHGLTTQLNSEQ